MRYNFPSQTKRAVDNAVASQFDALNHHPCFEKAARERVANAREVRKELGKLESLGIITLSDFRTMRRDIQFESSVVKFLDWHVESIDKLFAWLDDEVLDFKNRHPELKGAYSQLLCRHMSLLTHHHHYYRAGKTKQVTSMLGRDIEVNNLLENVLSDEVALEHRPIQYVIAPRRHSKSLMLSQVVASAAKHRADEGKKLQSRSTTVQPCCQTSRPLKTSVT